MQLRAKERKVRGVPFDELEITVIIYLQALDHSRLEI